MDVNNSTEKLLEQLKILENRVCKIEIFLESFKPYDISKNQLANNVDELFEQAKILVLESPKVVSASLLQRKFGIGCARAARLLDELDMHGVVKPTKH